MPFMLVIAGKAAALALLGTFAYFLSQSFANPHGRRYSPQTVAATAAFFAVWLSLALVGVLS